MSTAAVIAAALAPFPLRAADITTGASEFVSALADRVIKILQNKSLNRDSRVQALSEIFLEGFDVAAIGQFALGVYARSTGDVERRAYLDAFREYVVQSYAARFESYAGEAFIVTKATLDTENSAWVSSNIDKPGEEGAKVDWRIRQRAGQFKIIDVIVEGVSLVVTQRQEFSSILQRNGGSVPALTTLLHDKAAQLRQRS